MERDTDVRFENVTLDTVLGATEGASLRLVIRWAGRRCMWRPGTRMWT